MSPFVARYWEAFLLLSASRPVGMDYGAIPLSEIAAYCDLYEVEGDERTDLVRMIRAMDMAFLTWHAERRERKNAG